ncbi:MAG: CinA family protein [Deltaproteobacteria bacterium]|nr:CinA family protein [Deltaproteobacteria bacterium]
MKIKPGESLKRVIERCRRHMTIAVAESCTGGLVSNLITDVSGSSGYFIGGVVAYSNDVKKDMLGVKAATLKRHGAVSVETAAEMARGVRKRFRSRIGVSTTGIAGPTGGSAQKPVGTVCIAVCARGKTAARQFLFKGSRSAVKKQSALAALKMLEEVLDRRAV